MNMAKTNTGIWCQVWPDRCRIFGAGVLIPEPSFKMHHNLYTKMNNIFDLMVFSQVVGHIMEQGDRHGYNQDKHR